MKKSSGSIYLKGEGSAVGRRGQVKNRKKHTAIPIAQSQYMSGTLNVTKAVKKFCGFFVWLIFHPFFEDKTRNGEDCGGINEDNRKVGQNRFEITGKG